jgi:penicillin-binding protein 1A
VHAEYVAETVRQLVYSQYGDEAYTRGLNVVTSVKSAHQEAAYKALRKGIMDYEKRQIYRGPEEFVDLPADRKELEDAIDDALAEHPDNGDVMSAVVLDAGPKKIVAVRQNGERLEIVGDGLRPPSRGCRTRRPPRSRSAPAPSSA